MGLKILFILCPPYPERCPPVGLGWLAEAVTAAGHEPVVMDINVRVAEALGKAYRRDWTTNRQYTTDDFAQDCFNRFPQLFGQVVQVVERGSIGWICMTVTKANRNFTFRTVRFLKKYFPSARIILEGPGTFALRAEHFPGSKGDAELVSYFIVGESEQALVKILDGTQSQPNVIEGEQTQDLARYPKYGAFELALYPEKQALQVQASRGCPRNCGFCAERLTVRGYRLRTPENVAEEIRHHHEQHNVRRIVFTDSVLNGDLAWMDGLLDRVAAAAPGITWEAQIAVRNDMTETLLKKMKKTGCAKLTVGLESASDGVLKKMGKGYTAYEALCFLHRLGASGLEYESNLLVHFPGETEAEFEQTLEFVRGNGRALKRVASVSLFRNYPGLGLEIPTGYNETQGLSKIERLMAVFQEQNIPVGENAIHTLF